MLQVVIPLLRGTAFLSGLPRIPSNIPESEETEIGEPGIYP